MHMWLPTLFMCGIVGISHADYLDSSGEAAHEPCGFCHEYDGNPRMTAYPRLAGQQPRYIEKQLADFRAGRRTGTMQGTAELLSDEDIRTVADYFSAQAARPARLAPQPQDQAKLARVIFDRGDPDRGLASCKTCHGADALGRGTVPRLAGQHSEYLRTQFEHFRSGDRHNDPGEQMRSVAALLSAAEVDALSAYLARLAPAGPEAAQAAGASATGG